MFKITSEDEERISTITCDALLAATASTKIPSASRYQPLSFTEHNGVFVTLHRDEKLRGCIGLLDESIPFIEALIEAALKAATEDYRFDAVTPGELSKLTIEVTVLSPMKRIFSEQEIVIGEHGLLIERRTMRGLLLPQVASERGWDAFQFLAALCNKAHLPSDAWRDPEARLYSFSGHHFSFPYRKITNTR